MKKYIPTVLAILSPAIVFLTVHLVLHTQEDRRCRDALLSPVWGSRTVIECDHEQHTLVRDGDRWRCACPNTRLPESATE